jgi:hypothetical protein
LNHTLDFVAPANHRIEFTFARHLRQVATESAQRRGLDIFLRSRA